MQLLLPAVQPGTSCFAGSEFYRKKQLLTALQCHLAEPAMGCSSCIHQYTGLGLMLEHSALDIACQQNGIHVWARHVLSRD